MKKRQPKSRATKHLHFRELPSIPYSEYKVSREFRRFVKTFIVPFVKLSGYKLKEKRKTIIHCLHNLYMAHLVGKVVADNRDSSKNSLRISVWDILLRYNLANKCTGSQSSGYKTRYRITNKLIEIYKYFYGISLDYNLDRNTLRVIPTDHALVVLKDKEKHVMPFKGFELGCIRYIRDTENMIEEINQQNLTHKWKASTISNDTGYKIDFPPNVCLKQIHSQRIQRCARLYSWSCLSGQNLSKKERSQIIIDDEPVAELDFAGFLIRRLYHLMRVEVPVGDIYQSEKILVGFYNSKMATQSNKKIVRTFIKKCTNICLNTYNIVQAESAIGNYLFEHLDKELITRYIKSNYWLIDKIRDTHPLISRGFFTTAGVDFMTIDGRIMLEILHDLSKLKIASLGIHDSIVCKVSDSNIVERKMIEIYGYYSLDNRPVIHKT